MIYIKVVKFVKISETNKENEHEVPQVNNNDIKTNEVLKDISRKPLQEMTVDVNNGEKNDYLITYNIEDYLTGQFYYDINYNLSFFLNND